MIDTERLRNHGLEDEDIGKCISDIQKARLNGHNGKLTTKTVVGHYLVENSVIAWDDVASYYETDKDRLLSKKRKLVRANVLDTVLKYPSNEVDGEASELLIMAERKHQDIIFDGTSPTTWAVAAIDATDWVNMDCNERSEDRMEDLLSLRSTTQFYGERDDISHGDLGRLLNQRRHTIGSLRLLTGETTKRIKERLGSLSTYNDEYALNEVEYASKVWYWTCNQSSR